MTALKLKMKAENHLFNAFQCEYASTQTDAHRAQEATQTCWLQWMVQVARQSLKSHDHRQIKGNIVTYKDQPYEHANISVIWELILQSVINYTRRVNKLQPTLKIG